MKQGRVRTVRVSRSIRCCSGSRYGALELLESHSAGLKKQPWETSAWSVLDLFAHIWSVHPKSLSKYQFQLNFVIFQECSVVRPCRTWCPTSKPSLATGIFVDVIWCEGQPFRFRRVLHHVFSSGGSKANEENSSTSFICWIRMTQAANCRC